MSLNKSGNRRGLHGNQGRPASKREIVKRNRSIFLDQEKLPSSFIREAIDEKLKRDGGSVDVVEPE